MSFASSTSFVSAQCDKLTADTLLNLGKAEGSMDAGNVSLDSAALTTDDQACTGKRLAACGRNDT